MPALRSTAPASRVYLEVLGVPLGRHKAVLCEACSDCFLPFRRARTWPLPSSQVLRQVPGYFRHQCEQRLPRWKLKMMQFVIRHPTSASGVHVRWRGNYSLAHGSTLLEQNTRNQANKFFIPFDLQGHHNDSNKHNGVRRLIVPCPTLATPADVKTSLELKLNTRLARAFGLWPSTAPHAIPSLTVQLSTGGATIGLSVDQAVCVCC